MECEGVYIITSSDFDDLGPYSSLEDALSDDCFSIVTSSPTIALRGLAKKRGYSKLQVKLSIRKTAGLHSKSQFENL